ncbi:RING finger protein [Gregarina niphandrodes]|uniref:RING finger protein n=1 Tax=Gregarina niphandrodes TaxID=110365 RepID=A0A023B2W4_GRENI|nr:RING finger protein [Gregarina niphandrodes]EZG55248.1 RING finger protein [Gregarina niphandrodes]|eukprot:XP_011131699.1 RING finger protein [Gregarina niphandrodes]
MVYGLFERGIITINSKLVKFWTVSMLTILDLFQFAWFLYGSVVVFVNDDGCSDLYNTMAKLSPRRYGDLVQEGALDITPTGNNLLANNLLPDVMGGAMTHLLNRLNSTTAAQPTATGACAICVADFEPDDQVLQLPCDPRKHVFHSSCVQEWLQRSQQCPMCRVNIVQAVDQHSQQV